ncbi:GDSL-type esterase/lipase family protein [Actinoplanes sp. NPDC049118]|uniref:GDSL-type esterase/lipase family protein n=1 Tax=Actinoplanes sp. NPDC049118 TaxID=3155769 RepID=UPI0033EF2AA6
MKAELDRVGSIRRTLVFAAALAALLYFARSGATSLTVQVLFTAFIAAATIWLRGQYADSLDGEQWVIPRWFGGLLLATAFVLVVLHHMLGQGSFAVIGVLLAYFVAGSAIAQIRQSESVHLLRLPSGRKYVEIRPMRWGLGLTVAGVVAAFGGAALLGPARQVVPGALLIVLAVLVLLPVGLAIWSEQALRRLCRMDDARAWLWWLGGAGAAVFVAVTAAFSLWNSAWLIALMVVLALLVIALVSTTQADIAAVMAVVALMGVTPLQASEPGQFGPRGRTQVLVALGDSYMSGEGAAIYYVGTDDGGGNQCRRSPTAWAAMAAQDETNFDGLAFLACSGARTANVLTEHPTSSVADSALARVGVPAPRPQRDEPGTQLDAYQKIRGTFKPRIVVVSIGGNDAGFSTIGVMCVAPGNCDRKAGLWRDSLDQVRKQLRATYLEVDAAFPGVPVVVVPYPDPISIRENGCRQVALSRAEQRFVHEFLTGGLNRVIRQTAEEYGFHYLEEMQDALAKAHLQLCDPLNDGRPGINFIGLRSVRGIAEQRFNPANWTHSSLHPNERGHAAMLRVFQTWWATQKASITARETVGVPARDRSADALSDQQQTTQALAQATATRQAPPCSLFDSTNRGCRPQGQRWAYQQIGWTLLIYGAGVLLAAAGAWCFAVALFARSRRHWARTKSPPGTAL